MDIDGTLTPPREPLLKEMAVALGQLKVPFHVAAGSDLTLVESQFLRPLYEFGFRKDFEAFLTNGATHYHCPFASRYVIEVVDAFDFRRHLGDADFDLLVETLKGILAAPEFQLPPPLRVIGDQIIPRGAALNCAPIGRTKGDLTEEMLRNRKAFAEFDKGSGYRRRILDLIQERLGRLVREKGLRVTLGGETSFDFVIDGKDKTNAVRTMRQRGVKQFVFLGDALFPGGNDGVMLEYIRDWTGPGPCPLEAIRVDGWQHTIAVCRERGWLD